MVILILQSLGHLQVGRIMAHLFPNYKVACRGCLHSGQDICRAKTASKAN